MKKLFYRTRNAAFLWKVSVLLALVLVGIGVAVSRLNHARLDAFERAIGAPIADAEEEASERGAVDLSKKLQAAVLEVLENDVPFYNRLDRLYSLAFLAAVAEVELPFPPKSEGLAENRYLVAKALFDAAYKSAATGGDLPALRVERAYEYEEMRALADASPSIEYAQFALGMLLRWNDEPAQAGEAFLLEAERFDLDEARRRAVHALLDAKRLERLTELAQDPAFAAHFSWSIRQDIALAQMNWPDLVITVIPAAYEKANGLMVGLTLLVGLVWATILLRFNGALSWQNTAVRWAVPALIAGALSAHLTILIIFLQENQMGLAFGDTVFSQFRYILVGIGLREEAAKLIGFVLLLPWAKKMKNLEILTLAGLVGLGFAVEENINYFTAAGGLGTLARFVTANFLHISLTAMCGLALVRALVYRGEAMQEFLFTFTAAVVVHALYNAFLMVPLLADYSMFNSIVFVLLAFQYFNWLRYLRPQWSDSFSITAHFTFGIVLLSGASFIVSAWMIGPMLAFHAVMSEVIGMAIMLLLFYRLIPEQIT
jgi:protease PrsW